MRIPIRLEHDTIAEALVELRLPIVTGEGSAIRDAFPGLLFGQLQRIYPNVQRTQAADLPFALRNSSPELQHLATQRFYGAGVHSIFVGPNVVGIGCQKPYSGWATFSGAIRDLLVAMSKLEGFSDVERIGLRYMNVIPSVPENGLSLLKVNVQLHGLNFVERGFSLRCESDIDGCIVITRIEPNSHFRAKSGGQIDGLLVDVDTIDSRPYTFSNVDQILHSIEALHLLEKRVYFSLLTDATLKSLKPVYSEEESGARIKH